MRADRVRTGVPAAVPAMRSVPAMPSVPSTRSVPPARYVPRMLTVLAALAAPARLAVLAVLLAGAAGCSPEDPAEAPEALRAATYNIRHGRGVDDRLDLERTAAVLRELDAHVIGLQEVDMGAERSEGVVQSDSLATLLGMESVFGAFMPFQGGEYGMAILSALPVVRSRSIPLPPGGSEPRVALAADVVLPGGDTVAVVNVHFDWVGDDTHRFAQAESLAEVLDTLSLPWILLGDLNDVPGSRTLELFDARALAAEKPAGRGATFPSGEPEREIDHVFAAPPGRWSVLEARVIDERRASDHRPVLAVLRLAPSDAPVRPDSPSVHPDSP